MKPKIPFAKCDLCTLKDEPFVPPSGKFDAHLVCVGEAPGSTEVEEGKPFVGMSGQLLDIAIQEGGGDPEDTYRTNVVMCRPPGNRTPHDNEINCCRDRLVKELQKTTGTIMTLGKVACETLGVPFTHKSAWIEWDKTHWLKPAWHPAYVLRNAAEANVFLAEVRSTLAGPGLKQTFDPIWKVPQTLDELKAMLAECPDNAWVAFDIETDQVQWFKTPKRGWDPILMLQLCWDYTFGIVVDDALLFDEPGTGPVLEAFFRRVRSVGHNGKFDCVFLKAQIGVDIQLDFDTMLAQYILDETFPLGLKSLAKLEFGMPDYEEVLIKQYLTSRNDKYSKIPFEALAEYGTLDVVVTLKLREVFEERLRKEGQYEEPFLSPIMEASRAFTQVELLGLAVDPVALDKASEILNAKTETARNALIELSGHPDLNPGSPVQLSKVLYDELGLPEIKSIKIKPRSTGSEALDKLKGMHPIIEAIGEYRRVSKLRTSYVENVKDLRDLDGRVHGSILINGTEVGRLSVRNPALQTIPRASDWAGALIRGMYVAGPDKVFIVADYSQAELRVMAHSSNEPFLIDAYQHDRDLHTEVALAMYGKSYTKEQRNLCKMFNFSYMYGGTEYSFAQDAGLPINVARQFVADYNKSMPTALAWKRQQLVQMKTVGWVENVFHRRRHYKLITRENLDDARKACVHAVIAGTASDLTLKSLIEVQRDYHIPCVLTVHDSIIAEVDGYVTDTPKVNPKLFEQAEIVQKVMVDMGIRYQGKVPWKVDVEIRRYWSGGDMWVREGTKWQYHPASENWESEW
jgi:DNA polymerase-1